MIRSSTKRLQKGVFRTAESLGASLRLVWVDCKLHVNACTVGVKQIKVECVGCALPTLDRHDQVFAIGCHLCVVGCPTIRPRSVRPSIPNSWSVRALLAEEMAVQHFTGDIQRDRPVAMRARVNCHITWV